MILLGSSPLNAKAEMLAGTLPLLGKGSVGVLAAASSEPAETAREHIALLKRHGITAVDLGVTIDTVEYTHQDTEFLDSIAGMSGILLCGGNQIRLVETLLHRGRGKRAAARHRRAHAEHAAGVRRQPCWASALSAGVVINGGSTSEGAALWGLLGRGPSVAIRGSIRAVRQRHHRPRPAAPGKLGASIQWACAEAEQLGIDVFGGAVIATMPDPVTGGGYLGFVDRGRPVNWCYDDNCPPTGSSPVVGPVIDLTTISRAGWPIKTAQQFWFGWSGNVGSQGGGVQRDGGQSGVVLRPGEVEGATTLARPGVPPRRLRLIVISSRPERGRDGQPLVRLIGGAVGMTVAAIGTFWQSWVSTRVRVDEALRERREADPDAVEADRDPAEMAEGGSPMARSTSRRRRCATGTSRAAACVCRPRPAPSMARPRRRCAAPSDSADPGQRTCPEGL